MKQYLELLKSIKENGVIKNDRTGTGIKSIFGYQMRFDLSEGFPLLTTKKVFLKGIIYELLWFLRGDTNIRYLIKNGVHIWDNDAYRFYCEKIKQYNNYYKDSRQDPQLEVYSKERFLQAVLDDEYTVMRASGFEYNNYGDLGPVYGEQWRSCGGKDQIKQLIKDIKKNPDSRRLILSSWNVENIDRMALPPCHTLFQFYVANGKLSCQLYQRSADVFLGVPFNIASYVLLVMMVAQVCNLEPGEFIHTIGDAHLYLNHMDQVDEQLSREPKNLPKMVINPNKTSVFKFKYEDFNLIDYDHYPTIKAPMSF